MAIPQSLVDELMVKCDRHCCICRRFKPLHLQVHHIKERADGGGDEPDNLIVVCLTCHCDAHTQTLLSRRFTVNELKQHRDAVFKLVSDGKLPSTTSGDLLAAIIPQISKAVREFTLSTAAAELLIAAANADGGVIIYSQYPSLMYIIGRQFINDSSDTTPREAAKWRAAFTQLRDGAYIDHVGDDTYAVSHSGYLAADQLIALAVESKDE